MKGDFRTIVSPCVGTGIIVHDVILDPAEACFRYFASSRDEAERSLSGLLDADSIIVFGGLFDAMGQPQRTMQRRCEAELSLKRLLPNYKHTIISGGARGVADYRQIDPGATEARQAVAYCVSLGADREDYLEESLALETIGNLIFSTVLLFRHGLTRPVFISEMTHLCRMDPAIKKWFGKSSPIKHDYWPLQEPDPYKAIASYADQACRAFEDGRSGLAHPIRFAEAINGLSTDSSRNEKEMKTATQWLFANDTRYAKEYKTGGGYFN